MCVAACKLFSNMTVNQGGSISACSNIATTKYVEGLQLHGLPWVQTWGEG